MKHVRIFALAALMLSTLTLKAQTYDGSLKAFDLPTSAGNKVTVVSTTTTTTIKFLVTCFRYSNTSGFVDFKMNFKLATELASGGRNLIDAPVFTMTSADFESGKANGSMEFTATVSNSKLPIGGYLRIAYNIPSNGFQSYTVWDNTRYAIAAPTTPDPSAATLAKISSIGFSTSGLKVFSTYYLVENDVRLGKNGLAQTNNTNYAVDNTNGQNVNILIDETIWGNGIWYNDLLEALKVWNTANSNIKLNLIYDYFKYAVQPRVDIIMKGTTSITTSTETQYPDGYGSAGALIAVNSNLSSPTGDNVLNLVHSIGHALGLKHTPSAAAGYQNSVMKPGNATVGVWSFLTDNYGLPSTYDVSNIGTKYPVNSSSTITSYINGPETFNSTASVTYRSSYISSEAGINYHWRVVGIKGTNYTAELNDNNVALYDFGLPSAGNYQLQCTISGGKYSTPATTTKDITVI
jgi:hypothetical protein